MTKKSYLIYTTVTEWNEPPRARHQVTNELKKEGAVYFVEKNKTGYPRVEVKQVEENVYVVTPYYWLNYKVRYRTPGVNEQYHNWLLRKIKDLNVDFEMVISFDYTAPAINKYFDNVIFYCADDNVGFGNFNPFFINKYHTRTEKLVAKKAKLCIVTSDYMQGKIKAYNTCTHVVPLGAPPVTFSGIQLPQKNKQKPVLGLVGFLDNNLDFELLDEVLKQYEVRFIGPANATTKERLTRSPNAKLLGPKTGIDLYEELSKVDVCIAPYDQRKLNKGATPNKMWLYLALGKPSVIITMPNIKNWSFDEGLVYICESKDFISNCQQAYETDTDELVQKRIELSKTNSWSYRVQQIKDLYYSVNPEPKIGEYLKEAV